jgi:diguanylate cyclase (GGDEF)-like protein/PAS domain S-box-containing protein
VLGRRILPLSAKIGVRPQLSLVALIATVPLLALLLFGVVKNRETVLQSAATRAHDLARLGAERQDDGFQDAKNVLSILRRLPEVATPGSPTCHATLQMVAADYPEFTTIGVVDAGGEVACFSHSAKERYFRDHEVFADALAAGPAGFVVGKFRIGAVTGKPIVFAAAPLAAASMGEPASGIVFVAVDLDRAATHALDYAGSIDATLTLIDTRTATILVRAPNQLALAGRPLEGSPLVSAMLSHPQGGSVEAVDADGASRIFGFSPLIAGGGSGLMVAVGLSRAAVLAEADRRLVLGVTVALITALAAAGAAWFFADRTQFRAIRSLVDAAKKLGDGELSARAEMEPWQAPEFRALSDTLGDMAQSIERAQASLMASERQLRLLADNSTDMILVTRPGGELVYASPACRALLGWEPEEMLAMPARDAIHPEDIGFLGDRRAYGGDDPTTSVFRMRRKDGSYVWVESISRALPAEPQRAPERLVVVRDIDLRVAAECQLKESETRYRFLAENSADMVFQLDCDLVRKYVSPAYREILGYEPAELIGKSAPGIIHADDVERIVGVFHALTGGRLERAVAMARIRTSGGAWIWTETHLRAIKDPQTGAISGIIGAMRDISIRKAAEDKLEEANRRLEALAGQDGLTGLANRRTFDDALSKEFRRAARERSRLALIMIDVDRFKLFNDRYGHPAGDECLKRVSRAIEATLPRPGDLVARYGGEEFAALLPNTDESGAAIMADRIRRAILALAIGHEDSPSLVVTISAGIASVEPSLYDSGPETLVRNADRALYCAKNNGRNAIVYASVLSEGFESGRSSAA